MDNYSDINTSRKNTYDQLSKHINLGSFEQFNKGMDNPENRRNLYKTASKYVNLGSWDKFDSYISTQNQSALNTSPQQKNDNLPLVSPYKEKQKSIQPLDKKLFFGGQLSPIIVTANGDKRPAIEQPPLTDKEIQEYKTANIPLPSPHGQEEQQAQQLAGISDAMEEGLLRGKGTGIVDPFGSLIGSVDNAIKTGNEGADALRKGNTVQGILQLLQSLTEVPFHLGMMTSPGGAAFLESQEIANATVPEKIAKWQAPISAATSPQTPTGKAVANFGDMALQLVLAYYLGKGFNAIKGKAAAPIEDLETLDKENQNAIQEQSTGEVLQRQPGQTGIPGSERGRMEQSQQGNELAGTRGIKNGTEGENQGESAEKTNPQSQEVASQLPPEIAPTTPETGQGLNVNQSAGKVLSPEDYQALRDELKNKLNENPFDQFDGFEEVKPITKSETSLSNPVENIPNNIPVPESTDQTNGQKSPEIGEKSPQSQEIQPVAERQEIGQNLSNEDKINSLKSDLIDLRDNYNDLTGSERMRARRPIQDKVKELRALGVDAKFEIGKITIDGKPLRKPTIQPKRVDISKVEVKPEAEKTFEELTPKVVSQKVKASEIGWDGNDINEFSYNPKEEISSQDNTQSQPSRAPKEGAQNIPPVKEDLKRGEKPNRIISDEAYKKAHDNLTKNLGKLSAGIDPTHFKDLATVGAYHFENGLRKFSDWSKKMIEEYGDKIQPQLKDIWENVHDKYKEFLGNPFFYNSERKIFEKMPESTNAEQVRGILKELQP